jgi:hypothetical protein
MHQDSFGMLMHHFAGIAMKKKIMAAALDMAEHVIDHNELCSTIPEQTLAVWTKQLTDWERDSNRPNLFEETVEGT